MSKRQRGAEVTTQADVARRGLVSVNKLDYTLQPDLSVAVARSAKKHFFQQQTYSPGQRAICIFNSGAEYVDLQNSYLKFDIRLPAAVANADTSQLSLGCGSGVNFIKQVINTSRSGEEVERIEQVNQLAPVLDRYTHSPNWINTQGEIIGYSNHSQTSMAVYDTFTDGSGVYKVSGQTRYDPAQNTGYVLDRLNALDTIFTFVVPVKCISGFFKSFDRLAPSMLMSGFRFEMELEQALDVGAWGANATPAYTMENMSIVLDQYQLTDSIMRVLNEESAMRGLEVVFTTWYNHETAQDRNTSINVQIRKAVSRGLGVLSKIVRLRGASKELDPFICEKANFTKYQVRVGALYFPQQSITSTSLNNSNRELYHHTMRGLGKWKTPQAPTGVSYHDFFGNSTTSFQAIYTDLERSNTQKLTGMPINSARVAEIFATRAAADNDYRVVSYLHYVRLLRVFMNTMEVEE